MESNQIEINTASFSAVGGEDDVIIPTTITPCSVKVGNNLLSDNENTIQTVEKDSAHQQSTLPPPVSVSETTQQTFEIKSPNDAESNQIEINTTSFSAVGGEDDVIIPSTITPCSVKVRNDLQNDNDNTIQTVEKDSAHQQSKLPPPVSVSETTQQTFEIKSPNHVESNQIGINTTYFSAVGGEDDVIIPSTITPCSVKVGNDLQNDNDNTIQTVEKDSSHQQGTLLPPVSVSETTQQTFETKSPNHVESNQIGINTTSLSVVGGEDDGIIPPAITPCSVKVENDLQNDSDNPIQTVEKDCSHQQGTLLLPPVPVTPPSEKRRRVPSRAVKDMKVRLNNILQDTVDMEQILHGLDTMDKTAIPRLEMENQMIQEVHELQYVELKNLMVELEQEAQKLQSKLTSLEATWKRTRRVIVVVVVLLVVFLTALFCAAYGVTMDSSGSIVVESRNNGFFSSGILEETPILLPQ